MEKLINDLCAEFIFFLNPNSEFNLLIHNQMFIFRGQQTPASRQMNLFRVRVCRLWRIWHVFLFLFYLPDQSMSNCQCFNIDLQYNSTAFTTSDFPERIYLVRSPLSPT
jgi:hypothetical protein